LNAAATASTRTITVELVCSGAHGQQERLKRIGLSAAVERDADAGLIRLGPLAHPAAWLALEPFIGRPL
jgi:hypothetical protein